MEKKVSRELVKDGIIGSQFDDLFVGPSMLPALEQRHQKSKFSVAKSKTFSRIGKSIVEEIKKQSPKVNAAYQELQKILNTCL